MDDLVESGENYAERGVAVTEVSEHVSVGIEMAVAPSGEGAFAASSADSPDCCGSHDITIGTDYSDEDSYDVAGGVAGFGGEMAEAQSGGTGGAEAGRRSLEDVPL